MIDVGQYFCLHIKEQDFDLTIFVEIGHLFFQIGHSEMKCIVF